VSTPHPHSVADLSLAPVLIAVERNLSRLRESDDLELTFALDLNDDDSMYDGPDERAKRIERFSVRNVDLHGWQVQPTPDRYGLAVQHGEFEVPVMLGKRLVDYVENGAA